MGVSAKRKKAAQAVPKELQFEHCQFNIAGFYDELKPGHVEQNRTPLQAHLNLYSWGWNFAGQCGVSEQVQVNPPHQVQRSVASNYKDASCGRFHSVVVDENGILSAFGTGEQDQLGNRNELNFSRSDKTLQLFPHLVNPSGFIRFGKDLKLSEIASGDSFVVARENSLEEGVAAVHNLGPAIQNLKRLVATFPECIKLQQTWSIFRQEYLIVKSTSSGHLVAWGTGKHGELGLGEYKLTSTSPFVIPAIIHITKVSAGSTHVLALSENKRIYSWGNGSSGQLGHGDFQDRNQPEPITFFNLVEVEDCSAGIRHSCVIFRIKASLETKLSSFGRGFHGRLGNGFNSCRNSPEIIENFPPSLAGFRFVQVSCGGAHTLALAQTETKKSLANPWGRKSVMLSWGFGANGQLGTGELADSFIPVKVRFPEFEYVTQVMAGKSWSLCRTVSGKLFSWGRGWRGQLGHLKQKICVVPREVSIGEFPLRLSAGHYHSLMISTKVKSINQLLAADRDQSQGRDAAYRVAEKQLNLTSVQSFKKCAPCQSRKYFSCCRRDLSLSPSKLVRVICLDCNTVLCLDCAKFCHRRHNLIRANDTADHQLHSPGKALSKALGKQGDLIKQLNKIWKKYINISVEYDTSEIRAKMTEISNLYRKYYRTNHPRLGAHGVVSDSKSDFMRVEVDSCECGVWNSQCRMLPVIPEHQTSHYYVFYIRSVIVLQRWARQLIQKRAILNHEAKLRVTRYKVCSTYFKGILQNVWRKLDESNQTYKESIESNSMAIEEVNKRKFDYYFSLQRALKSMNALMLGAKMILARTLELTVPGKAPVRLMGLSLTALRTENRKHLPERQCSRQDLTLLAKERPIAWRREGEFPDLDMFRFIRRFLQDSSSLLVRHSAPSTAIVSSRKSIKKGVAPSRKNTSTPTPTPIPGSKSNGAGHMVLRATRRHSISDPCQFYSRLRQAPSKINEKMKVLRRNSLPDLRLLHTPNIVSFAHPAKIKSSVSLFKERAGLLADFVDPDRSYIWRGISKKSKKFKVKQVAQLAWLNPRLPSEILLIVTSPKRRRTIAEPERLSRQLKEQFEIRNKFETLRNLCQSTFGIIRRRRSFDVGEAFDVQHNVNSSLGYHFEQFEELQLPNSPKHRPTSLHLSDGPALHQSTASPRLISGNPGNPGNPGNLGSLGSPSGIDVPSDIGSSGGEAVNQTPGSPGRLQQGQVSEETSDSIEPSLWYQYYSDEANSFYFFDPRSGSSQWEKPTDPNVQMMIQIQNAQGQWVWRNSTTGEEFLAEQ